MKLEDLFAWMLAVAFLAALLICLPALAYAADGDWLITGSVASYHHNARCHADRQRPCNEANLGIGIAYDTGTIGAGVHAYRNSQHRTSVAATVSILPTIVDSTVRVRAGLTIGAATGYQDIEFDAAQRRYIERDRAVTPLFAPTLAVGVRDVGEVRLMVQPLRNVEDSSRFRGYAATLLFAMPLSF